MFISVLDLFKLGVGPSSSHTVGPMVAANQFIAGLQDVDSPLSIEPFRQQDGLRLHCELFGSLSLTGKGHATDRAVMLGLHGHQANKLAAVNVEEEVQRLLKTDHVTLPTVHGPLDLGFVFEQDITFTDEHGADEHPNTLTLSVKDADGKILLSESYCSIGGGFIQTRDEYQQGEQSLELTDVNHYPHPFEGAEDMLAMAEKSGLSVAQMKRINECADLPEASLNNGLDAIWETMKGCVENGLNSDGELPGGLKVQRRARNLFEQLKQQQADGEDVQINEWLCAYAMAVNEENAAGHAVVTAPTNGAAGVIPAVLYYFVAHKDADREQIHDFLLTAAAIGGLIKHRSSISGAEVGCQGEVGSASAMAAAGLCAIRGGNAKQIEQAAEIALEHHLGLTCDPVAGLVQVPCIERNGFGALKAWAAASLALRGDGEHMMSLDSCVAAMKQIGDEMSEKFKETSLGGLAVKYIEC